MFLNLDSPPSYKSVLRHDNLFLPSYSTAIISDDQADSSSIPTQQEENHKKNSIVTGGHFYCSYQLQNLPDYFKEMRGVSYCNGAILNGISIQNGHHQSPNTEEEDPEEMLITSTNVSSLQTQQTLASSLFSTDGLPSSILSTQKSTLLQKFGKISYDTPIVSV